MMNTESGSQHFNQELNPAQALATQFRLTPEETRYIIGLVQQNDPSIESLKQPKVQELIKQRKGRWVQEEEDFANFLSDEFCLGLSPIDNGITKRAYLSNKLACTKMRISKKFKGKHPGKEVFLRKDRTPDGREFSQHDIRCYEHRHVQLEKRFIKAVLKSVMKSGVKNAHKKQASPYAPPGQQATARTMQLPNAAFTGVASGLSPMNSIVCTPNAGAPMAAPAQNLFSHGQLNPNNRNMQMISGFAQSAMTAQINTPASIGMQAPAPALNVQQAKPTGFYSQPAAAPNVAPACANQLSLMAAMIQAQGSQLNNHVQPTSVYGQPQNLPNASQHCFNQANPMANVPNASQHCANQANPMAAMKMQVSCGIPPQIKSHAVSTTSPGSNQVNPMMQIQIKNHAKPTDMYGQPQVVSTTPPGVNQVNPMPAIKMQVPCGIEITTGLWGQPLAAPKPIPSVSNQPTLSIQAPQGTGIQGHIHVYSQNSTPTFQENSVGTRSSNETPTYHAPAWPSNTQNVSGSIAADGLKKRQITELPGSVGYGFPRGKRFKPTTTADESRAISTSASEPSSNDESDYVLSSNEASSCSRGISKRRDLTSANLSTHNDMPDLLSGFDNHFASVKTHEMSIIAHVAQSRPIPEDSHLFAGAGIIGESPYITSKSFDELHLFPEKVSQLDLDQNAGNNYQPMGHVGHKSSTGTIRPKQIGFHPSYGAFVPYVVRPPQLQNASDDFERQSSISNSSDLTASD